MLIIVANRILYPCGLFPLKVGGNGSYILVDKNFSLDYCYFVYNQSVINLFYNINLVSLQIIVILTSLPENHPLCTISGSILMMGALLGIVNQAFLAVNRYCLLFEQSLHKRFFGRKLIKFLYVFLIYLIGCVSIVGFLLWNDFGFFNGICSAALKRVPVWHFLLLFSLPATISYSICIFVAFRITSLVKNQTNNNNDRLTNSRITEGRSIVKFICMEVAIPLVLETPILLSVIFHDLIMLPSALDALLTDLFIFHTVLDPVITVAVIKPYRQDFLLYYSKIFKKNQVNYCSCTIGNLRAYLLYPFFDLGPAKHEKPENETRALKYL
uniref:G-protein coupled receptors family 1 profile domain-containing protein n=1 Tax=Romanomermis culicivorax TaxID=13658 RepID=A0A915L7K4_ROMCU